MGCLGFGMGGNDEPLDQWAVTYTVTFTLPYLGINLPYMSFGTGEGDGDGEGEGERCKVR